MLRAAAPNWRGAKAHVLYSILCLTDLYSSVWFGHWFNAMEVTEMVVSRKDMEALEGMVDRYTLFEVLVALDVIAGDKAEHLRANWQDVISARTWESAGRKVIVAAKAVSDLGL